MSGATGRARKSRIVCVGINNVDLIHDVRLADLRADSKILTGAPTRLVGGQSVNAAFTMAGFGLSVSYVGTCGSDANGEYVRQVLAERGVDASRCLVAEGMPNTTALIFIDPASGERCIVVATPEGYPSHPGTIDEVLWRQCAYLYFDGNEIAATLRMAAEARRRGIPTLADVETLSDEARQLIGSVDTAIVPMSVGRALAGSEDRGDMLRALRSAGARRAAVTMGPLGAIGMDADGNRHEIPAVPIEAVDTTGAGDAFHAAFLVADLEGARFADALSFAALVAAEKCRVKGPSLPIEMLRRLRARLDAGA